MIRIAIVDDHPVVRQGLRLMLEQRPDFEVVGEGGDGAQAIALAIDLVPDVMLLDLLLPGADGISAIREIKRLTPTTQVIVLMSYAEDDYIFNANNAGALSYLLKDAGPEDLITISERTNGGDDGTRARHKRAGAAPGNWRRASRSAPGVRGTSTATPAPAPPPSAAPDSASRR